MNIEVGVYAGVPLKSTLKDAFCCTTAAGFIHNEVEDASYVVGASGGILLRDRFRFTFGATYMPVEFRTIGTSCCPISHPVSPKHGTAWEFPLLADYRLQVGPLRPFGGGGLVLYNRTTGGEDQSPSPMVSGGIEWQVRQFVIRPELRFIRFTTSSGSNIHVSRPPSQLQLLLGFAFRK